MLADRRILVTGASRGIGRAVALACAREGAVVGIGHLHGAAEATALQAEIASRDVRAAHLCRFDVADEAEVTAGVGRFVEATGGIDGLVCAAGVSLPDLLISSDVARIRRQLDTNALGPLLCARAALPTMLKQRRGVIVNVSSVAASTPSRGQAVYAASKGAVESLTRALAVEYGKKGIRAVCLRPGPIATDMLAGTLALAEDEVLARVPLRRIGSPEDIAEMAVFLLGDRAAYITGCVYAVDGGHG